MLINRIPSVIITLILVGTAVDSLAAVTAKDAAQLGQQLTPIGAEKKGNTAGTIPAWTGGITSPPDNYKIGDHHPDPYANDKILFTITAANAKQYKQYLTPGQLALLKKYNSFSLPIYPSHRSASYPDRIYDATIDNATKAKLVSDGNGIADAVIGYPFPVPQNAQEVMWNHILRYRGDAVKRYMNQAALTRSGKYTLVRLEDEFDLIYSHKDTKFEDLNNIILYFKQKTIAPARLAGSIILVHETLNQAIEPRLAWTYNTGQRRVRRAPEVSYDTPGTGSDGLRTNDQFDMFNGALDRYNWKLIGKKEIYVPYNTYKIHSDKLDYDDVLNAQHLNPAHTRYELHRVWVVEATVKRGTSHLYPKRTFYLDEDSWQILLVDQYDARQKLWRVSEGHVINYYEVPTLWTTLEVHYDLQSGRYLVLGLNNKEKMYDFSIQRSISDYTPAALRREGMR